MSEPRFTVASTAIEGLKIVTRSAIMDDRGFLSRLYCADELSKAGFDDPIIQINQTLTRLRGTIRGLHYQHQPFAEAKFVSVMRGEVLDVAVDLRDGSPTFLHYHAERLSAENRRSLFIPKGFAHGFQTLLADCELLYLHTNRYDSASEDGLNALDPQIGILWPLPVAEMSDRDRQRLPTPSNFTGIKL